MATEVHGHLKMVTTTIQVDATDGAHATGDYLSNSNSSTLVPVPFTFSQCAKSNGRGGKIHSAIIISESEDVTPAITLYLYNANPSTSPIDNTAAAIPAHTDLTSFIGTIVFPNMRGDGDDSYAIATEGSTDASGSPSNLPLPFLCADGNDDLYGIAVTNTEFTQTPGDDLTIKLLIDQW